MAKKTNRQGKPAGRKNTPSGKPGGRQQKATDRDKKRPAPSVCIFAKLPLGLEFEKRLAAAPPKAGFDYPTTLEGSTAHFQVYYQTGFANGPVIAQGVLATVERDYDALLNLFGGMALPTFPISIIIAFGIGGVQPELIWICPCFAVKIRNLINTVRPPLTESSWTAGRHVVQTSR